MKFILLIKSKSLEHTFPMAFYGVRQKKVCMRCEGGKVCFIGSMNCISTGPRVVAIGWRQMGHYLYKPNGSRLLAETLTAQIEAILANETRLVCAESTANRDSSVLTHPSLSFKAKQGARTTGGNLFRTYEGEKTKRRRGSCFGEEFLYAHHI